MAKWHFSEGKRKNELFLFGVHWKSFLMKGSLNQSSSQSQKQKFMKHRTFTSHKRIRGLVFHKKMGSTNKPLGGQKPVYCWNWYKHIYGFYYLLFFLILTDFNSFIFIFYYFTFGCIITYCSGQTQLDRRVKLIGLDWLGQNHSVPDLQFQNIV